MLIETARGLARDNMRHFSIICLMLVLAATTGCKDEQTSTFNRIVGTDFGLGLAFELSKDQVVDVIGEPATTVDKQSGTRVVDFYISPEVLADDPDAEYPTDANTPQLQLTYLNGYLFRLYNRWIPEDEAVPYPPFFMEPVPGVKLGCRRSDIQDALGPPSDPIIGTIWKFKHKKDGRQIQIEAGFTEMPTSEEELCTSLSIVLIPSVTEYAGEEKEKRDNWRQDFGL